LHEAFYFLFLIYIFRMNIFIAGLSYNINDADLKDLFGEYGEISSAKVITDRETGRSKGYGFVEIADETAGQKAIDELNGAEYDGRTISVSVARPRAEGAGAPRRGNGGGGFNRGGGNAGGGGFRSRERY
jgi:RNA recognition motif-containing protein